jgi:hypothetical protein
LIEFEKNKQPANEGRNIANSPGQPNGVRASLTAEDINNGWIDQNGLLVQSSDVVADTTENEEGAEPQLLNSPPPEPPTSDGDIVSILTPEENNSVQAGVIDNPDAQLRARET